MSIVKESAWLVELSLEFSALRAIPALFHGVLADMSECSEVGITEVRELQTLGEVNYELQRSLDKELTCNEQLRLLFDKMRIAAFALKTQRLEYEEDALYEVEGALAALKTK